jgi:hypothetical protein
MSSFQEVAFRKAREHFQKAVVLDDLEQARAVSYVIGYDLGVQVLSYFSRALCGHWFFCSKRNYAGINY